MYNRGPNYVDTPQNPYQPPNLNASDCLPDSFILRDSQNICAVCFEAYEIDKIILLDCGHAYHGKFIRSWVNKQDNCPLCRVKI